MFYYEKIQILLSVFFIKDIQDNILDYLCSTSELGFETMDETDIEDEKYINNLPHKYKQIIFKHLRHSGQLRQDNIIQQYLIDQLENKKMDYCDASLDIILHIQDVAKCELQKALTKELNDNNYNTDDLYYYGNLYYERFYDGKFKDKKIKYVYFEYVNWQLSLGNGLNDKDKHILKRFKENVTEWYKSAVNIVNTEKICEVYKAIEKRFLKNNIDDNHNNKRKADVL